MYCAKCGKELADNAMFCEYCGAKVETEGMPMQQEGFPEMSASYEQPPSDAQTAGAEKTEGAQKAAELKEKFAQMDNKKKMGLIGGAAVVLILLCVMLFGGKSVNLSKYVELKVEGSDGYGVATWDFDEQKFAKDYGKKLKFSKKAKQYGIGMIDDFVSPCDTLAMSVSGSIDKKENLSNGDEIVFTWDESMMNELEQMFNLKFKVKEKKLKVSGLEEVASFDAFEGVTLEYEGCEPLARAWVNTEKCPYGSRLNYDIDISEGLSNGDKVTVTVSSYDEDVAAYCAEVIGMVPKSLSKEFTVEGLNAYVTAIDQISDDMMKKMQSEMEDSIRAQAAADWREEVKIEDLTYIGSYLLNLKPGRSSRTNNCLVLVYQVSAHENFSESGVDNHITYYTAGSFYNLMKLADGTCSVDLSDLNMDGNRFDRELPVKDGWWSSITLYYRGYEELETLFNRHVTEELENYTYTSSVSEPEEEPAEESAEEPAEGEAGGEGEQAAE